MAPDESIVAKIVSKPIKDKYVSGAFISVEMD